MFQDYFTPAGNQKKKPEFACNSGLWMFASLFGHVAAFRLGESG
jgi:hypothetical protein